MLDSIPSCSSCGSELGPQAKFCPSCGTSLEEDGEAKEEPQCPSCGATVPSDSRFCSECGSSISDASSEKTKGKQSRKVKAPDTPENDAKPKRTIKRPVQSDDSELEEDDETESDSGPEFDFSRIDPREEWECFGEMYEEGSVECDACPFKEDCAKETKSE